MRVQVLSGRHQDASFVGMADIDHEIVNEDNFWGAYRNDDAKVVLVDRLGDEYITDIVMSPDGHIIG